MSTTNDVKQLRAEAVAYLAGKKNMGIGEIKQALGRESIGYDNLLYKALKTVKICQTKAHPQVSEIDGKKIYLATPITLYSGPEF